MSQDSNLRPSLDVEPPIAHEHHNKDSDVLSQDQLNIPIALRKWIKSCTQHPMKDCHLNFKHLPLYCLKYR